MPKKHPQGEPNRPPPIPQGPPPIIRDTRFANTPFGIGGADENGTRELSFIVGQGEIHTYLISAEASDQMVKELTGGIQIAQPGDVPSG
jgi:hypothetical protein